MWIAVALVTWWLIQQYKQGWKHWHWGFTFPSMSNMWLQDSHWCQTIIFSPRKSFVISLPGKDESKAAVFCSVWVVHLFFEHRAACQTRVIDSDGLIASLSQFELMMCYYKFMHNAACADVFVCEGLWVAADKILDKTTFLIVQLSASLLMLVLLLKLNSIFATSCYCKLTCRTVEQILIKILPSLNKLLVCALNTMAQKWLPCVKQV